jgi:hypothetical protein
MIFKKNGITNELNTNIDKKEQKIKMKIIDNMSFESIDCCLSSRVDYSKRKISEENNEKSLSNNNNIIIQNKNKNQENKIPNSFYIENINTEKSIIDT